MRLYAVLLLSSLALFACSNSRSADPAPISQGSDSSASPEELGGFVRGVQERLKRGGCLEGCGDRPALPRCPAGVAARPMAEITAFPARDELQGKAVVVRGPLRAQMSCTALGCAAGTCCNDCDGGLVLGAVRYEGYDHLVLANTAAPDSVRCVGDDTTLCCAAPAEGEEVVVMGTLGRTGSSPAELQLSDATLCVP